MGEKKLSKVSIIGSGNVGSTFAFVLMSSGLAREIVIVDRNEMRAKGEAMDLSHGASFVPPTEISSGGYNECRGSDIVVITAGARQKPGQTRIDLLNANLEIFKDIIPRITKHTKDAILLIVTNPVDILTYAALKISKLPKQRVIGSGTVLDSSRFRFLISKHCHVDPRNVHAYIIGEHGDTEVPLWSNANIGGILIKDYCPRCNTCPGYKKELTAIFEEVKKSAYKIIEAKGATYYAVALALVRIVGAILRDENSVLPVSTIIEGYYGIKDICLSIPSIVNKKGVEKALEIGLSSKEQKSLKASALALGKIKSEVGL